MNDLVKKGYLGNLDQLISARRVTIAEGPAKGADIIEVRTAGGLALDVLPDTGLDLGQCSYKGVNMSYLSKNGYDSPAVIGHYENEFSNHFPGGLLYTCGLRNAGPANRDGEEWQPTHGRYHSLSATQVSEEVTDSFITIRGRIRETALFGHVLEVRRTIRIPVSGAYVEVEDKITNLTPRDEAVLMIYHCNFGYPLLSEKAQLVFPEAHQTLPRTDFAKTGLGRECVFDPPQDNEAERVFFHVLTKDYRVQLENPELGVRMTMTWSGSTLPLLSEWRSMGSGDYVLGLEPCNTTLQGRAAEKANGTAKVLKAYETMTNKVKIDFASI